MNKANLLTRVVMAGALATSTLLGGSMAVANAQTPSTTSTHSWTTEQVVTSSVREAWQLGGKSEQGFFEIVQALTEISAQKRGVAIPDNEQAGKKAGEWIKRQAKKDPDQLLYVIVDRAVQFSARKTAAQ
jgi:hypothetical protein